MKSKNIYTLASANSAGLTDYGVSAEDIADVMYRD